MFNGGSLPSWLPLPILIFLAELCVVTLCTMRMIFISRGRKLLAPMVGFFEITIWLFAIGQIMKNLNDLACYVGFAAGFTLGNFLGLFIETKLALGSLVVRIVTHRDARELFDRLRESQFGLTLVEAEGATGPVTVILTIIHRRQLAEVVSLIKAFDPRTFYSVEDVQSAASGIFPASRSRSRWPVSILPWPLRMSA
jgi:uncharacterized protein YebE (UPF0316 family)